jgi:hypothetical protein
MVVRGRIELTTFRFSGWRAVTGEDVVRGVPS